MIDHDPLFLILSPGAAKAKGKVITFLDAHCEATEGWLEPLMAEIHKDRYKVLPDLCIPVYEPPHGKTNNLHRRKQRRRSASR